MQSIKQLLDSASERLPDSESSRVDMEYLLCELLQRGRSYLFTYPEYVLTESEWSVLEAWLQRRAQGEPVAYILKKQSFWNIELKVSPSTLIPRADTECLVETALALATPEWQAQFASPLSVIDLGTGTGAIALALASECPSWTLLGVDRVAEAVALAQENARLSGMSNVAFLQSNWCDKVPDGVAMIVSNPPYIDPEDPHLSQGDVRFEPLSALIAEDKGLADIATICEQAKAKLLPSGWLIFEHGYDQAQAVRALLLDAGYTSAQSYQDYGGNDRVTAAQWLGVK